MMPLKTPNQAFDRLWSKVPGYIKLTFAASMVLGLVAHLFAFTNKFMNHDEIGHLFKSDYGTASGRWFLAVVLQWDGDFSMPWLIGLMSLLCISAAACFTVALFRIRRPIGCIITAGLMMAFPTVAATFSYMFTADAYFFSLALAAFGAYAACRFRWAGIPLGVIALILSMGIYQSYYPAAAALMLGALIFETLDGDKTFRELLLKGVRLALVLALSMIGYLIMVRLTTRTVELVDYMGISSMGQLSLAQLPGLIAKCYSEYAEFFFFSKYGFHFKFIKYLLALSGLCTVILLAVLLWRRKLGVLRTVLAVVMVALYPMAGNLIYIMTSGGTVHHLMIYGMVFLLLAPIALVEYMGGLPEEQTPARQPLQAVMRQSLQSLMCWVILGSLALTAYSYFVADNKAYLKAYVSYEQSYAYSNRLLSAIESCEGYQKGMPVALVGSGKWDAASNPTPQLDEIQMVGLFNLGNYRAGYSYNLFLRYYLGFTETVYLDKTAVVNELSAKEEVIAMPCYPQTGSVQVVDGFVVVKLSEITP